MSDWDPEKMRLGIARDLRKVEELTLELHAQALASPNDRDFPGGTALHMLAPAASIADWEAGYEETENVERFDPKTGEDRWLRRNTDKPTSNWRDPAVYQGDTEEQPLNVLESWTRIVREERDQPTALKATISREVAYLRGSLDWMLAVDDFDEPAWPAVEVMAEELRTLVRRMENTLRAGDRIDTDAAPCFQLDADGNRCKGTLARVNLRPRGCEHTKGVAEMVDDPDHIPDALAWLLAHYPHLAEEHKRCDQGGRDDLYRCLKCQKNYTTTEYWLAVSDNHERQAAGQ